jgi:hypothetical protein
MTFPEIARLRLRNQKITSAGSLIPAELVAWLGAVQSQDFAAAKWALGLRLKDITDKEIEAAFNRGDILRTHLMRPTWHFVAPQDIRWLLKLTAPRVISIMNNYSKKLGMDEPLFRRGNKLMAKALQGGEHLTRAEMEVILNKAKMIDGDYHMMHLLMRAELDGVICSGPRRGKQFTYALLDERVPQTKQMEREDALAELVLRYFMSHGPATIPDFVWWSGLTTTDAKAGLEMIKSKLEQETINGQAYWFSKSLQYAKEKPGSIQLLPAFDEYTVAYKDRHLLVDSGKVESIPAPAMLLSNTIVVDGNVVGTWKRTIKTGSVELSVNYFHNVNNSKKQAITKAAERYGEFLGLPAVITN